MKCPCEECILIPVCKHKLPPEIIKSCELVDSFLGIKFTSKRGRPASITNRYRHRLRIVKMILEPTRWTWGLKLNWWIKNE